MNRQIITFLMAFGIFLVHCNAVEEGRITGDNVRLRESPNGRVISKLNKDAVVEVFGITENAEPINNMVAPWYLVKTKIGQTGWVFGRFIDTSGTYLEIQKAYKAANNCGHWGGEQAYNEERRAQIEKGMEEDCKEARERLESVAERYPENPAILRAIEILISSGHLGGEELFIHRYCDSVWDYLSQHPESPSMEAFEAVCKSDLNR